jgi:DNA-binding MarR family transcriptional regulator
MKMDKDGRMLVALLAYIDVFTRKYARRRFSFRCIEVLEELARQPERGVREIAGSIGCHRDLVHDTLARLGEESENGFTGLRLVQAGYDGRHWLTAKGSAVVTEAWFAYNWTATASATCPTCYRDHASAEELASFATDRAGAQRAVRAIRHFYTETASDISLQLLQAFVAVAVEAKDSLTEYAALLGWSLTVASRHFVTLAYPHRSRPGLRGLVEVRQSPQSRRQNVYNLTKRGEQLKAELAAILADGIPPNPQDELSPQAQIVLQFLRGNSAASARDALMAIGISPGAFTRRVTELRTASFKVSDTSEKHPMSGRWIKRYTLEL